MIGRAGLFALAAIALSFASPGHAQALPAPALQVPWARPTPLSTIQSKLDELAAQKVGRVGIAVVDLQTGERVSVNGNERFPMASVVKLAVAAAYLSEVDAGRRTLDRKIALDEKWRVGSDGIAKLMPHPGVTLSAANLIELMMRVSDNTATDMLVADLGGPSAVQRWLDRNRLAGVRMDRTIAQLVLDNLGLPLLPGKTAAQTLWDSDKPADELRPSISARFDIDPRDTATPLGIADFLQRHNRGELLSKESRGFLIDVMSRCETGADRIPGQLPVGTRVEHKTGTLGGISNDVGIVTLADGRRFVIAVFTREIADGPARAKIIADVSRAAYDQLAGR